MMKVSHIYIYPIKSLGGISVDSAECVQEGFIHDRRMMLVDAQGKFISQREIPEMALLSTSIAQSGITITHKKTKELNIHIPFEAESVENIAVSVWNHNFTAALVEGDYSMWFSDLLKNNVRLVKMNNTSNRQKSLIKAPSKTKLSLADGYPYLIISQASLDDLNTRLDSPIPMDRFRPNVVISGNEPYGEEDLDKFNIGKVAFRMIKPCGRCIMITIDQNSANKLVEPLKTLSTYKKKGNNVNFGMNAVSLTKGIINVGDKLFFDVPVIK